MKTKLHYLAAALLASPLLLSAFTAIGILAGLADSMPA